MKKILLYIIAISLIGCGRPDVCDWQNYLENINNSSSEISIHPSENWFKPELLNEKGGIGRKIMLQDFRQFEFVSSIYEPQIDEDLKNIKNVKNSNSQNSNFGKFNTVHIRKEIPIPINVKVTFKMLETIFDSSLKIQPIIISNCGLKHVKNGFLFENDGIPYYGVYDQNENITVLGIIEVLPEYDTKENHVKIRRLMEEFDLLLVGYNSETKLNFEDFEIY